MTAVSDILRDLYQAYERGNNGRGQQTRVIDESGVSVLATQSGRGDMVIAEHLDDDTFAVIRVERSREGKSERNRRLATSPNPNASTDRQFKNVEYQLKTIQSQQLRSDGGAQALHQACHWNRNTTRVRTANSAQQLVRAWEEYVGEHT